MSELVTRRRFFMGLAAPSLLAGCEGVYPVTSFLQAMKGWNEKFEGFLFSPCRVAPEMPLSATTRKTSGYRENQGYDWFRGV